MGTPLVANPQPGLKCQNRGARRWFLASAAQVPASLRLGRPRSAAPTMPLTSGGCLDLSAWDRAGRDLLLSERRIDSVRFEIVAALHCPGIQVKRAPCSAFHTGPVGFAVACNRATHFRMLTLKSFPKPGCHPERRRIGLFRLLLG